jgi:DNA-directed RNA polymerase specialized sigma24 family protein
MAPLKSLPDGQRLVLHLLLEDGRSYAEIAELLSIDRAATQGLIEPNPDCPHRR